jgi:hypothetical protein
MSIASFERAAMSKQWFYQVMGSTIGPVTSAELKLCVQKGQIPPDTQIRLGPDGKWQSADRIKGLLDATPEAAVKPETPSKSAPEKSGASSPTGEKRYIAVAVPSEKKSGVVAMPVSAPKKPPSSGEIKTYHIVGEEAHDDAEDESPSGEYDFFRFVGFENAIGPALHRVLCDHCRVSQLTLAQATRRALADYLGRKDLRDDAPAGAGPPAAEPAPEPSALIG